MEELQEEIREYLTKNRGTYYFIIALFVLGVLSGGLTVRGLEDSQHLILDSYFNYYIEGFTENPVQDQAEIFRQSLRINFQYIFLTWLLGIFLFGYPLICGLVFLRGFSVGFTVAFLVERASFKGVLFAMGSILPHNLILVPALIIIAVTGFSFSWLRFKSYLEKCPASLREHIGPYTLMIFLVGLLIFLGVLIEAYISPVFVKLLIPMVK